MEPMPDADRRFFDAFRQRFTGVLQWEQLDSFWRVMRARAGDGWYLYAVGEVVPVTPASGAEVERFIGEIDALLRREHEEDYCGIVYTDSLSEPTFVKIFDPNNLGVQCGFSDHPPLPGWVMSLIPPADLLTPQPLPGSRRRWWRTLWA
ncbi:MAG: hypothetical protein ACYCQK_03890 [Acidiferrobacteraceae bacterium]